MMKPALLCSWTRLSVRVICLLSLTCVAAAVITGCGRKARDAASDQTPFRVALIANGPLTDFGFNQSHRDALSFVEAQFGPVVQARALGDIPETGDAERTMRRLIADGNDLIIAASFGYQDSTVKLAQEFPDKRFLQAWGFMPADNLGTYSAKMYEAWYVMGVVAGQMTRSSRLGIVAAHPIPPMKWQINAYVLGARSVNPDVTAQVAFINHWFDPGLAAEAAESLIRQGCDVLCGVLDNSVAVARVAERRGVMLIGHNSDLSSFAPNAHLAGTRWLWGQLYADAIEQMRAGTWNGNAGDLHGGFKEGYVGITDFSARVPEEVQNSAHSTIEAIKAGQMHVYRGPIQDNRGNLVVKDGETLDHGQIMSMDWMVEGIR